MSQPHHGSPERLHIADAMRELSTKRQLADLFRYLGIRATRRLGQHFLIDPNLLDFIVRAGEVGPDDLVLDIGCGTGLLTAHLADAAGRVIGIEVDRRLFAICSRYLEARENVELICGDALASKHRLAPALVDAAQREVATGAWHSLRVVSNLPYCIATLLVPNLLESGLAIAAIVATVQKEVADRLVAGPGCRQYGSLSVVVQVQASAAVLRPVPPAVFWPRPQVDSAIVRLLPEPGRLQAVRDYPAFVTLVRAAFTHRRKRLANALAACGVVRDRTAIEAALAHCGISPGDRAEHVAVGQYVELANTLAEGREQEQT